MKQNFVPKDDFDAEVVTVVDREFDYDHPFKTIVAERKSKTYSDFDSDLWELWELQRKVSDQSWLNTAKGKRYAARKKYYAEMVQKMNGHFSILKERHGAAVMEILMEGRLKIAFLVDSDGGDMRLARLYTDGLKALDKRSHSQTYVTIHASSAAMELVMTANQSLMLNKSHLLWHFSGYPHTRRETVEKLKQNLEMPEREQAEILELREYFDRAKDIDAGYFDYLLKEIKREENPEGELTFGGKQLDELHLVKAYKDIDSLRRRFNAEYMSRIDEPILEFWDISKKVIEEIGSEFWGDFFSEKMRAEWKDAHEKTAYSISAED